MQATAAILKNNNLAAAHRQAPQIVTASIQKASTKTGVDFAYLMDQAKAESSYNPAAKAKTSSASGLFQFIERTWLDMVNRHGAKYGLEQYAAAIDDKLRVSDKGARQEILALRNDPQIASYMAAEFANENKQFLERTVGGAIGATELYFAHFLGASGASGFLKELQHNPSTIAADIMPKAARANRNVFYDSKTGQPRTLQQVYDFFDKKFSPSNNGQTLTAQNSAPLPPRKPAVEMETANAGYNAVPISHSRSVVFARAPQAGAPMPVQAADSALKARELADYRTGANQIAATNRLLPMPNAPLSIADLLMLSAVDL